MCRALACSERACSYLLGQGRRLMGWVQGPGRSYVAMAILGCGIAVSDPGLAQAQDNEHDSSRQRPEVVLDPGGIPTAALVAIYRAVDSIARLAEDQDLDELSRLHRRAIAATQVALQTEGYFAAEVTLEPLTDVLGETWVIEIQPGQRSRVGSVQLDFEGPLSQSMWRERIAQLRRDWSLPEGQIFRDADWVQAKDDLLFALRQQDFPGARLLSSRARVRPGEPVRIELRVHSGPRVHVEGIEAIGLRRAPVSLLPRYATFESGDPYERDDLIRWQEALQQTPFFSQVLVELDEVALASDLARDETTLPVKITLREAPARRLELSGGYDSDSGLRAEALYLQNVVVGRALATTAGLRLESRQRLGFIDLHFPPDGQARRDSAGVLVEDSRIEGLELNRAAAAFVREQTTRSRDAGARAKETQTQWLVRLSQEQTRLPTQASSTLRYGSFQAERLWRDVDQRLEPRDGHLRTIYAGVGTSFENPEDAFFRVGARAQYWWPRGADSVTLRMELAQVFAADAARVPQEFLFRTGGARSVRGYAFQSLGREVAGAIVGERALWTASVQYTHWLDARWGIAGFVDFGGVGPRLDRIDPVLGIGLGARLRTLAGPIEADIAWSERDQRLRLHFSLGIAF